MGTSDGTVLGMTKIFDSGPPTSRWNFVIVSEGYRASEMAQFTADANAIRDFMFTIPPFDRPEIIAGINIYRLDVTSTDSGADNPDCDGVNGGATTANTYFDSTFCVGGTQRAMGGDDALVSATVGALLPDWHQIQVLINDPERGGAAGSIAWSSNQAIDWRETVIHEMGHSAFGLADEYDVGGPDTFADGEPSAVNVSKTSDPATVKWSSFVTAGSANPTRANPDCTATDPGPSPVAAGIVGTFEGAKYSHCGIYRPAWTCMMRSTFQPFCPVCLDKVADTLAPFAQPAPGGDVTLATLTVDFNDVPTGLTVNRAARFNVNSALPVTFQAITSPTAPFANALGSLVVAPPAGPAPWPGYFWFSFTAGNALGPVPSQQVTLRCLETGEDFVVTLVANVVTRPRVATQLVFDKSGSMLELTDEGRTKEQVLRDAAAVFVDLLWDDNGIGLNAYDHDPHPILDVAVAGAPGASMGRDAALAQIAVHASNPAGFTAIGDGIELARQKLDAAPGTWDNRAMLVLTDGIETADKKVAAVADSVINAAVYAIGLGTPEQIRPATLDALTSGTGGYLLMTGNLSQTDGFLLEKYYLQILAGVNNNDLILDPEGRIGSGEIVRIPFDVTDQDVEITAIVLGKPANVLIMALETPTGDVIGFGHPSLVGRVSPRAINMRAGLPLIAAGQSAQAGRWNLLLAIHPEYQPKYFAAASHGWKSVPYSASVAAYSNLRMDASVHQSGLEPGATLTPRVLLTEYGAPFGGSASVRAELTRPDTSTTVLALSPVAGEAGVFQTGLVADQSGIWRFRFLAAGQTSREQAFTRETLRTAAVWRGGDQPDGGADPGPGGDGPGGGIDWGELLDCMLCGKVINRKLAERLRDLGFDLDELCKCVKRSKSCGCENHNLEVEIRNQIAGVLNRLR